MASKRIVRIGTSNIVVPGTKKTFPEAFQTTSRLTYYATLFNTLEINSSFYKVPLPKTFERWSNEVSDNFQFTVKLWREITHAKKLTFKPADIDFFMNCANCVADKKKGCLLVQFPASITIDFFEQVEAILERLQTTNPRNRWRICVEFRHTSWYIGEAYEMLNQYKASLVMHDMPASRISVLPVKAPFAYVRLHGVQGDYRGSYEQHLLQEYAAKIKSWMQQGKDVYVYFNNTMGEAYANAQSLYKMVT